MQQSTETHATLTSPMDGVISFLSAKKGERANGTTNMMGTEMMRVADFNHFEMRVDVAENDISKVAVGDSANRFDRCIYKPKITGVVTQIASSPNSPTMGSGNDVTNYKVYIRILSNNKQNSTDVQNIAFRPGMTGSADIQTKTKQNVLAVPLIQLLPEIKMMM